MERVTVPKLFILAIILYLSSCSLDDALLEERPSGSLSALGYDAELVNANVSVYLVDDYLERTGDAIVTGSTDENGEYLTDLDIASQYILVRVGGAGYYLEEASGEKIELAADDYLNGIIYYQAGDTLDLTITGFTHIATTYVQCLVEKYGEVPANAFTSASSTFGSYANTDLFNTRPINPTLASSEGRQLDEGMGYGILAAAVSQYMLEAAQANNITTHSGAYTSFNFYQYAARDISADRNCALDGIIQDRDGTQITLGVGNQLFSTDTYRVDLARAALSFLQTDFNLAAVGPLDYLYYATALADAESTRLFAGEAPTALDDVGPTITLQYEDYAFFGGLTTYSVVTEDYSGVISVQLYIDDVLMGEVFNNSNPTFTGVNTSQFTDGEHTATLVATDGQYNQSTVTQPITVWNAGPIISLTSNQYTNQLDYTITLTAETPAGLASATINGVEVTPEGSTLSAPLSLTANQVNSVVVTATDALNRTTSTTVDILMDRVAPVSSINVAEPGFADYLVYYSPTANARQSYEAVINMSGTPLDPFYLTDETVALNGVSPVMVNDVRQGKFLHDSFQVGDYSSASQDRDVTTPSDLIKVTYTYEVKSNGVITEIFADKPLSADGEGLNANDYSLVFVEEFLGANWYLTSAEDVHYVTIKLEDLAGNTTTYTYQFKVRYFPDDPLMIFTELASTAYAQYSMNNTPSAGSEEPVYQYNFTNEYPFDIEVKVDVTDPIADMTNLTHSYYKGARLSKYHKKISTTVEFNCSGDWETQESSGEQKLIYYDAKGSWGTIKPPSSDSIIDNNSDGLPTNYSYTLSDDLRFIPTSYSSDRSKTKKYFNFFGSTTYKVKYTGTGYGRVFNASGNFYCSIGAYEDSVTSGWIEVNETKYNSPMDYMNELWPVSERPTKTIATYWKQTTDISYSWVAGYPKDDITYLKENYEVTPKFSYLINDVETVADADGYIRIPSGANVTVIGKVTFPAISFKNMGTGCIWRYNTYSYCDDYLKITAKPNISYELRPYHETAVMGTSTYSKTNADIVTTIN